MLRLSILILLSRSRKGWNYFSLLGLWKKKIDWIASKGGMALLNVHPDYVAFDDQVPTLSEFPSTLYAELLRYVNEKYAGAYWHALPRDLSRFYQAEYRF
jgi:hypothetical protein